jgi:hypothetical protein
MRSTVIRGAEGLFLDYVSSAEIAGLLLSARSGGSQSSPVAAIHSQTYSEAVIDPMVLRFLRGWLDCSASAACLFDNKITSKPALNKKCRMASFIFLD